MMEMYSANYEDLISNASMHIYDYAIHRQQEMRSMERTLPFYVMSYIKSGRALLRAGGAEYALHPHSVIIIPPNVKHDHIKEGDGPTVFLWWHFDYKVFETIDLLRLMGLPMVFSLEENAVFEEAFNRYLSVMDKKPSLKNVMLKKAYAIEVMAHLFYAAEKHRSIVASPAIPEVFQEIMSVIISSTHQEITLSRLAGRFNMHPTYLSNRFRSYYGIAPIAFYRKLQLERAKKLLSTKNMTVSEVAEALGYKDPAVFSRFFAKKAGFAPSQIDRQNL